jgi:hypothetical protein
MTQSIGDACLHTIASTWQVDKAAVKWVNGGFDWTPGSHLVEVRAEKSATEDRWKVSVTTKFLDSVPIKDRKFIEGVAALSAVMTSTYAMQYPSAEISNNSSSRLFDNSSHLSSLGRRSAEVSLFAAKHLISFASIAAGSVRGSTIH